MAILAIDPGLSGTGWTIMSERPLKIIRSGVVFNGYIEWTYKGEKIAKRLLTYLKAYKRVNITRTYIEFPSLFQSAHGQMVARKGDLVKLAWFTGLLHGILPKPKLVPVIDWKGQLPKDVVKQRIVKILGRHECRNLRSHDWDAVGIGLWAFGEF